MGLFNFLRTQPGHPDQASAHPESGPDPEEPQKLPEQEAALQAFDRAMMVLELDAAIEAHVEWRNRLRDFINGVSKEVLNPGQVCRDDSCSLGKWLNTEGEQSLGKFGSFIDLKTTHKLFHDTAGHIVAQHLQGHTAEARRILENHFHELSSRICQRLDDMKAV